MEAGVRRFACTLCGRCCNRSPEVQLSEAAALSDVFVFRLMFRLYSFPNALSVYREGGATRTNASDVFFQSKRLLGAHAASTYSIRIARSGKTAEYTRYMMISALTLETGSGSCGALRAGRCTIHERRPVSCRTVPLHYSRVDALAESDLDAFVSTPGYECDTSKSAPVFLKSGRIVDESTKQARTDALALAERDRRWKKAIVHRLKVGRPEEASLPSLRQIEANATVGAMTTSMRIGWQIAVEAGLMKPEESGALLARQVATIDRELAAPNCTQDVYDTLVAMRMEYRRELNA